MSSAETALPITNPATGEALGRVPVCPDSQVSEFYARSRTAYATWRTTPLAQRLDYVRRLRERMVAQLDDLARQISEETGKVQIEALTTDILPALEAMRHLEKHATKALAIRRTPTPILFFGKTSYVEYKPRGVVLVIAPWNFPLQLTLVPMLNALVGGNTVVLKPSEVTPRVGVLIEQLFEQSGWPQGVVQVAHGGKETGAALVEAGPDYIFFTGSVRTGRAIQQAAAAQLIPTTLELGGKDPMIVFADAPFDRAIQGAMWGGLMNSGQVCMGVERIYVERSIYDTFVQRLCAAVKSLRQGRGADADADIGSMTFPHQVDVVRDHVAQALAQGAVLRTGKPPSEWRDGRMFIEPMVLTGVTQEMAVVREETFGPVLPVIPFDNEAEAIALANDSDYGLSASVWTANTDRGRRVATQLVSGNVLVNDVVITIVNHELPFGGEKTSGLGRYHGAEGMRMFCRQTSVMVDKGRRLREVNWFPYSGKYDMFIDLLRSYYGPQRRWGKFLGAYLKLLRKSGAPVDAKTQTREGTRK